MGRRRRYSVVEEALGEERSIRTKLETHFPKLIGADYQVTSPETRTYNCIAWAAGDVSRIWWPDPSCYWPPGAKVTVSVDAFIDAFQCHGYEIVRSTDLEAGFEKIVFFVKQQKPTHAARQLPDGTWTSKLGRYVDIMHPSLDHISGKEYGYPLVVMARPRRLRS